MNILAAITLILLIGKIYCMSFNKLPGDIIGMIIVAVLLITATLTTEKSLSCFSSSPVVLVGVLFVIGSGLIHSGIMQWIIRYLLGVPKRRSFALIRLMVPVAFMSAFISNMAVVFLFINVVKLWSRKLKIVPSKLMIPLSYASMLGGLCTLIGNAPNLVVAEFYTQETGKELGMFSPLPIGLACCVVGFLSMAILHRWLPVRKSPDESFESSADYTVELLVPTDNMYVGETVEEAGLHTVNGGHLVEIVRFDREVISPVPKNEFILGGDRLVYSGKIDSLLEMRSTHGLVNATHHVFSIKDMAGNRKLQMASVDAHSPLVGHSMSELDFEETNGVVLIAIARQGERLTGIPREMTLRAGDTLLLEGNKLMTSRFIGNLNFFDSIALPQSGKKTMVSALIMLVMILMTIFDVMPLIHSCMIAAMAMVLTKCLSIEQLQRSINWRIIMVFAGSVCLGFAIEDTGIAQSIADSINELGGTNPMISLIIICFASSLITQFISNTTAAAVFAPIALRTALSLGVNPLTFTIALMMSVSCSFATPIASETNTLVYGPGGYRFKDYMKIGFAMNFILLVVVLLMTTLIYPF